MVARKETKPTPLGNLEAVPDRAPAPALASGYPEQTTYVVSSSQNLRVMPLASCTATAAMADADSAAGATPGHSLLARPSQDGNEVEEEPNVTGIGTGVPKAIAFRLYTSHFLSTWNSRLFEFGAALFLTSVFPGTLLPVSIYSLVRNAGYIIFSQPLGRWMNKGNRLNIIRTSIVGQRVPVAASCALLLVLELKGSELGYRKDNGIFAVIVLLAVVEKLCSTMNTISVERDWVRAKHLPVFEPGWRVC